MRTSLAFVALFITLPIVSLTAALGALYTYMVPVLLEFSFTALLVRIFLYEIYQCHNSFLFDTAKIIILGEYTGIHIIGYF